MQTIGFTLGVEDILTVPSAEEERNNLIQNVRNVGPEVMIKGLNIAGDVTKEEIVETLEKKQANDPNYSGYIDREYKSYTSNLTDQMNRYWGFFYPFFLLHYFNGYLLQKIPFSIP